MFRESDASLSLVGVGALLVAGRDGPSLGAVERERCPPWAVIAEHHHRVLGVVEAEGHVRTTVVRRGAFGFVSS